MFEFLVSDWWLSREQRWKWNSGWQFSEVQYIFVLVLFLPSVIFVQITRKCNESARDLENRELLNEISKSLTFKRGVKVSNASITTFNGKTSTWVCVTLMRIFFWSHFESCSHLVSQKENLWWLLSVLNFFQAGYPFCHPIITASKHRRHTK